MARIEQDNFSNVSWHSESVGAGDEGPSSSSIQTGFDTPERNGDEDEDAAAAAAAAAEQLDPAGLGSEVLECTVSQPLKENEGSKDVFVSYLISTYVCIPF